jgi:hypothetical protein
MRIMRLLLVILFVAAMLLRPSLAEGPPQTPEARSRHRLKVKEYVIKGGLYTHNHAVLHAADDMAALVASGKTKEERHYYRYLSLHNIPRDFREDYYNCISFILNSVSRKRAIVRPAFGGPENILVRVNLFDYGIDPEAWDNLGQKDPYFHQIVVQTDVITKQVQVLEWHKTGRYYQNGEPEWAQYYVNKSVVENTVPVRKQMGAAWCDPTAAMYLNTETGTAYPILRADWFIVNVTLDPHYSEFLGIKSFDDIKKLALFDERADDMEIRATVVTSGSGGMCPRVARNNRILARRPTVRGYWWETFDYTQSIGEKNVIHNFLNKKRDAGEFIFTLPNGLQGYALTNNKFELQKEAPNNIAVDSMAYDAVVKNGRSCIWCHAEGINKFKSQFQLQVGAKPDQADLGIFDEDPKKALTIQRQILEVFALPNFDDIIRTDNSLYAKAVFLANGLEATENAALFKRIWDGYQEELIEMKHIVFEVGLHEEDVKALLALRFNAKSNGVLIQALLKPPIAIRRDQWEENFFELALLSTLKNPIKPPVNAVPVK